MGTYFGRPDWRITRVEQLQCHPRLTDVPSKMIIVIPTNMDLTAYGMARIYRDHVWSKHGVPRKVISDRGLQFAAQFMRDLHKLTGTTANLLTAYHPQMDGQTEQVNQEVEQYL
jgi:hypothetical protein